MFKVIKKIFSKKPIVKKEKPLILKDEAVDATYENEIKKNNKDTKETKSSLTSSLTRGE